MGHKCIPKMARVFSWRRKMCPPSSHFARCHKQNFLPQSSQLGERTLNGLWQTFNSLRQSRQVVYLKENSKRESGRCEPALASANSNTFGRQVAKSARNAIDNQKSCKETKACAHESTLVSFFGVRFFVVFLVLWQECSIAARS